MIASSSAVILISSVFSETMTRFTLSILSHTMPSLCHWRRSRMGSDATRRTLDVFSDLLPRKSAGMPMRSVAHGPKAEG